ncbi:MAG TPA: hypothetical protein VJZ70_02715 [Limnochordia bacterium]|jgi:hypothetical protein|nr:hypothetical protein [Limnochordia bacterium]
MARIITNVVIAEIETTKIASLELKAPLGVGVDLETGDMTKLVKVTPLGEPVLRRAILPGKLINEGFLKTRLIVEGDILERTLYLPIFSVTEIEGIQPGDHVLEFAELEHSSVSGLPDVVPLGQSCYQVKLFVRALLKIQITVTREEVVSLPEENPKESEPYIKPRERSNQTASSKKLPKNRFGSEATWNRYWAYMHR